MEWVGRDSSGHSLKNKARQTDQLTNFLLYSVSTQQAHLPKTKSISQCINNISLLGLQILYYIAGFSASQRIRVQSFIDLLLKITKLLEFEFFSIKYHIG